MNKYKIDFQHNGQIVFELVTAKNVNEAKAYIAKAYPGAEIISAIGYVDVYKEKGYENRKQYIESLADEYNLSVEVVANLAKMLGPSEDFDGLVSACQDIDLGI